MRDQPTWDERDLDGTVLWRLCASGPWAVADLRQELGLAAVDAVGRLVGSGLAHRMEGGAFVVASIAGRHAHGIDPTYR